MWRGNDAGFGGALRMFERWLNEDKIRGVHGSAKANELRKRVHELRESIKGLIDAASPPQKEDDK